MKRLILPFFPQNKFTIDILLGQVSTLKNIEKLSTQITDPVTWLNKLIRLVLDYDPILLDKYNIIPNQLGVFMLRKDDINWDEGIDDSLFEIHELITRADYRKLLLHKDFETNTDLLSRQNSKNIRTIAKVIDDAFSDYIVSDRQSANFQSALRLMFKWFSDSNSSNEKLKELFKWFAGHRPQLFLETFDDEKRDQAFVIVQSGKLQSLAKLAESNLTSEEINGIATNIKEIKEFVEITNELGGMTKVLDHAKDLLSDKRHFEYMKKIGESVEYLFKDTLKMEKIDADIIHTGWGSHDFELKSKTNGKSFFVELKSFANGSKDPIKLAVSQAKKAVDNPSNFALCLLERPAVESTNSVEFIRKRLLYHPQVRALLVNPLNDNNQVEKIINSTTDAKLYISLREEIRISIAKDTLVKGCQNFEMLIEAIKKVLQN